MPFQTVGRLVAIAFFALVVSSGFAQALKTGGAGQIG